MINLTLSIGGTEVAVIFVEQANGGIKLSFRSRTPQVDCNVLAKQFGGGGHKAAAGAFINEPFDTQKPKCLTLCARRCDNLHRCRSDPGAASRLRFPPVSARWPSTVACLSQRHMYEGRMENPQRVSHSSAKVGNVNPSPACPNQRRSFLAIFLGGILAVFPFLTGLVVLLDPLRRRGTQGNWIRIATLDSLPDDGIPRQFEVIADKQDAWNKYLNQPIGVCT